MFGRNSLDKMLKDFDKSFKFQAPWGQPRRKFGPFHFYRMPRALRGGWGTDRDEIGLTWSTWEKRIKNLCPFQFWFRGFCDEVSDYFDPDWIFSSHHTLGRFYYDHIKIIWKKHNIVKIKTLPSTWNCISVKVTHTLFELLRSFIEEERAWDIIAWDEGDLIQCKEDLTAAWNWWEERGKRKKKMEAAEELTELLREYHLDFHATYFRQNELEEQWEKEEQIHLQNIVKWKNHLSF